ncbi:glycoside hydrolase family 6 protein [Streptomyces sp. H39-S7]|uniref:glycoside hydrolase family 6 protein n=1 Tax=Streptomyces sp. H39-S7 TaxID=3004357 RepID=UPI0022B04C7A|nr:glycoside hydrolase family 6 protein [Streptomyces sp. H39-S7]MCZ4118451.1 glycoside hydrolase family 6 protein [Streptomyces sp. H39-S7]
MRAPTRRRRTALMAAGVLIATGSGTAAAFTATNASAASDAAAGCSVAYTVQSQWNVGFTAQVTITNTGPAVTAWNVGWSFAGNQKVTQGWSADIAQTGAAVTAKNLSYNGSLGTGASTGFGFNGSYSGTNTSPTAFTLNGVACNGGTPTTPPTTPPTSPPTDPPTDPPTTPPTTPPPGTRVDNPYAGAKGYVNPEWSAKAAAEPGGSRIANQSTAVWLDRIAAINGVNGGMGLRAHLNKAVTQAAGQPLVIELVIYDLPGRDCAALASNGELGATELGRYKTEYIDPIAAIIADPAYAALRIVTIVEPDSLPNLVTNAGGTAGSTEACATMKANGNYEAGVGYALHKLGAISNVYNYIDAGHHGWLGWDTNMGPAAQGFLKAATTGGATVNDVTGFIVNTANYGATTEPFFKITDNVNGTSVRQSKWVDWNYYVDEQSYAQALRTLLVTTGFNSNLGMLIDTSRNGWGGTARPTGPGATTSVDTYVNGGRTDRRIHLGNWCNQSGAGIGQRPTAAPATGIDAYVWVKPPGESDGASSLIPNDEGKGFDRMCDPTYTGNGRNGNSMSGALANSPLAGQWFSAQFQELLKNAYPAL